MLFKANIYETIYLLYQKLVFDKSSCRTNPCSILVNPGAVSRAILVLMVLYHEGQRLECCLHHLSQVVTERCADFTAL